MEATDAEGSKAKDDPLKQKAIAMINKKLEKDKPLDDAEEIKAEEKTEEDEEISSLTIYRI